MHLEQVSPIYMRRFPFYFKNEFAGAGTLQHCVDLMHITEFDSAVLLYVPILSRTIYLMLLAMISQSVA